MKTFVNIVLFIPRLIWHMVWGLFWGIVRLVLLLAVVIGLLFFYAQNSDSALAQQINQFSRNVSSYFQTEGSGQLTSDLTNAVSQLATDTYTSTSQSRWATSTASVYIDTQNQTLVSAYQDAISNWNSTAAFTFTLTNDKDKADIVATDYSDSSSQAAGLANTTTDVLTNRITHVDVMLNTYYLTDNDFGYTYERIVNTAVHELGHAIGLDHDDSEDSVMQSSGSYYGIQLTDIEAVQTLYAT